MRIEPFQLSVEADALDDLRDRLRRTRWPEAETVSDWGQGAPLDRVRALCEYWRDEYDWRRCEDRLNSAGQFIAEIDGLPIHFLHVQSPVEGALPLLLTHGWPGSVIEFLKVLGPLSDPAAHGGDPADAFHLVVPSLPGFGFSGKPQSSGWGVERIARAWIELMERLGYGRFVAQGGDWGSAVTTAIAMAAPPQCAGIHLNLPVAYPTEADLADLSPDEAALLSAMEEVNRTGTAYAQLQATKPQTIGYALTDSPAGQAAWIYEKFHGWTDNPGTPEGVLSRDELLDNIMMYWLPGTAASSARLYWESYDFFESHTIGIPVGVTQFPKEILRTSRRWAERCYSNLIYWNEAEKGGHFAAFEQPEIFVDEVRKCFRLLRG
ncbi:epoxide hydrolase family protein [Novosphingobium malaysiense]|uniref:Epoxide hydrolase n=1 Tax=Novosphingobium malaysiense TaxID=1348853 RepID=A0A0B1ZKH6_9SPHN|nr:epoxide hydrolase family protein [Novosphingobium malaysiense]KHK89795.1 epoxide hydrolase [Novosphingobium malaysiense]